MIDLSKLLPGDEYIVEWNDGDRQRYRVEEIRGDYVVRKRWVAHLNKWTEWNGVQKISEMHRFTIEPVNMRPPMNWETKLLALKAFSPHHLEMRKPGDWYVCSNVEVVGDGVLIGDYGNGTSPEQAVEDHWRRLVDDLPMGKYLRGGTPGHTVYARWNGFMWSDASHLRKPQPAASAAS